MARALSSGAVKSSPRAAPKAASKPLATLTASSTGEKALIAQSGEQLGQRMAFGVELGAQGFRRFLGRAQSGLLFLRLAQGDLGCLGGFTRTDKFGFGRLHRFFHFHGDRRCHLLGL